MKTEQTISCPHCQREYQLRIDLERVARLRTQAVCTRCTQRFDIMSRIKSRAEGRDDVVLADSEPASELKTIDEVGAEDDAQAVDDRLGAVVADPRELLTQMRSLRRDAERPPPTDLASLTGDNGADDEFFAEWLDRDS